MPFWRLFKIKLTHASFNVHGLAFISFDGKSSKNLAYHVNIAEFRQI